jgi:hypothetical protein
MRKPSTPILAIGVAASIALAACGTSAASQAETSTTSSGHDHDMASMDMGASDATPAYSVEGASLVKGQFEALSGADGSYGTAWLARHSNGTTVTIELESIAKSADHMAHVHSGPCDNGGGPHYKFDPSGDHHPPNEIHLAFTSDAAGLGVMTATNESVAGPEAVSVVVHSSAENAPKFVCADLTHP